MKIKLDENLPAALAVALAGLGHDVDTVVEEDLCGCSDLAVWGGAQAAGRLLVTQDLDFSDLRKYGPGGHAGILIVPLAEPSRKRLVTRVMAIFADEPVHAWTGCVVVATERKLRIRRP